MLELAVTVSNSKEKSDFLVIALNCFANRLQDFFSDPDLDRLLATTFNCKTIEVSNHSQIDWQRFANNCHFVKTDCNQSELVCADEHNYSVTYLSATGDATG